MNFIWRVIVTLCFVISFSNGIAKQNEKIVIGIPPWGGTKEKTKKEFEVFIEYLAETLEREIVFVVSEEYSDLGNDVSRGLIDVAIISSSAYVKSKDQYDNIEYICSPLTKDMKHSYESYIIVRADSGIENYQELKDKTFAFVDENSSSGYKFPLAYMIKNWGINPNTYFSKTLFLGTHPNVIMAVYNNQVVAGAVYEKWEKASKIIGPDKLVAIEVIENIPRDGVVVYSKLDEKLKQAIKEAFLSIDKNTKTISGKNVLANFLWGGFVEKDDEHYDIIRETNQVLKSFEKK